MEEKNVENITPAENTTAENVQPAQAGWQKNLSLKKIISIFAVILVVIIGVSSMGIFDGSSPLSSGPSNSNYIEAAKIAIRDDGGLKSPSQAKFYGGKVVEKDNYGRALVTITVDAMNSYGGYKQYDYIVIITSFDTETSQFTYSKMSIMTYNDVLYDTVASVAKNYANWNQPKS